MPDSSRIRGRATAFTVDTQGHVEGADGADAFTPPDNSPAPLTRAGEHQPEAE